MANPNEEMVFDYEGGNGFDFYFAYCSVKLKFLSKKTQFINGYIRECLFHMRQFSGSTFSQHKLMHFPISRVAEGHE